MSRGTLWSETKLNENHLCRENMIYDANMDSFSTVTLPCIIKGRWLASEGGACQKNFEKHPTRVRAGKPLRDKEDLNSCRTVTRMLTYTYTCLLGIDWLTTSSPPPTRQLCKTHANEMLTQENQVWIRSFWLNKELICQKAAAILSLFAVLKG